jgi:hypothetical protein
MTTTITANMKSPAQKAADTKGPIARKRAAQKAVDTKGPIERKREALMAAWTKKHGKDDAKNPHSRQNTQ